MATFEELINVAAITVHDKTSSKRMGEILHIMRHYQVTKGMTPQKAVDILEALGPTYVKIGQLASNRTDLLPASYCQAFEKLQDNATPLPYDTVLECISEAYGRPWDEVFVTISEKPLGAASIAQVHKATLLDGTTVAVKVRRPGIKEQMMEDIMLMKHMLAILELHSSDQTILRSLDNMVKELDRTTANEVDFRVELSNLERFRGVLADQEGVTCPRPYPRLSCESVLVMEYVVGPTIDDVAALKAQGDDVLTLANRVAQSYVSQVLDYGFFHADPHAGNLIIRDKEIVWIDLGMVGTLTDGDRRLVQDMFRAVAFNNGYLLKEAVVGLSTSYGEVDHGALLAKMDQLLKSYGTAEVKDINIGVVFGEVVEILRTQNLVMKPSVSMLVRGFMTLEGLIMHLAPTISVADVVNKHVLHEEFQPKNLEAKAVAVMAQTVNSLESLSKIPTQVADTLDMLDKGQLTLKGNIDIPDKMLATIYAMAGRLSLAIISVGLFLGSSILCTTDMEPRFLEVPILGVLGYIGAFVLGVYVIWRVIVTRHVMENNEKLK